MAEKKRYQVTLTGERADAVKDQLRRLGLHPSMFSTLMDEALQGYRVMLGEMLRQKAEGKQLNFETFLKWSLARAEEAAKSLEP